MRKIKAKPCSNCIQTTTQVVRRLTDSITIGHSRKWRSACDSEDVIITDTFIEKSNMLHTSIRQTLLMATFAPPSLSSNFVANVFLSFICVLLLLILFFGGRSRLDEAAVLYIRNITNRIHATYITAPMLRLELGLKPTTALRRLLNMP